eukprot:13961507-Alexandrium_andersonii.AAC.1
MQLRDAPRMLAQLPEDQLSGMLASFAEEVLRLRARQAAQVQQQADGLPPAPYAGVAGGPVGGL